MDWTLVTVIDIYISFFTTLSLQYLLPNIVADFLYLLLCPKSFICSVAIKNCFPYRQIKKEDFNKYDYIFGMDDDNMNALKKMAPADCKANIILLITHDPQGDKTIRDPFYDSNSDGFETCYQQCVRACNGFLDSSRQ